jgi:hypothetical protein
MRYYYSVQPFLAWCFNHYFYGGVHYAYMAAPFNPYGLKNPKSSNPLLIYQDYYSPWKDKDESSDFIENKRNRLSGGVIAMSSQLGAGIADRLKDVAAKIDLRFLYPIVYRADLSDPAVFPLSRLEVKNSGLVGSQEYLVRDLSETEFDVLFFDPVSEALDPDFMLLWNSGIASDAALNVLEKWC